MDNDDDNDGWIDTEEGPCGTDPLDPTSIPTDTDVDGMCDPVDPDDDDDGTSDWDDDFPLDSSEHTDTDGDGTGDNADTDDDGDGLTDTSEYEIGTDPLDEDTDDDGWSDQGDTFPLDPNEWKDKDGDGVGDNSDTFPLDSNEWNDKDGDGVGDNSDVLSDYARYQTTMDIGFDLVVLTILALGVVAILRSNIFTRSRSVDSKKPSPDSKGKKRRGPLGPPPERKSSKAKKKTEEK
jgi:hypothetical protein